MRASRIAVTVCSGLLGLGALVSQAIPAQADPKPMVIDQSGDNIQTSEFDWKSAPKPMTPPSVPDMELVLPEDDDTGPVIAPPYFPPSDPEFEVEQACIPGTPTCDDTPCVPIPGGPNCPTGEPDCETHVECCEEGITLNPERPCPGDEDDPDCETHVECCEEGITLNPERPCPQEDPCDEDEGPGPQRNADEDCCIERPEGGDDGADEPSQRRHESRDECPPDTGTDGSDGTTDGGGRLPKTGAEMATYGLAGLAFVGIGAALKRLGRKTA